MEALKEIISMFTAQYVEKIRHLESDVFKNSKSHELFQGIKTGQFNSDESAREALFGTGTPAKDKFRKLKKKLTSILLSNLFLKSTEDKTDYTSVHEECVKNASAVKILTTKGHKLAAMHLAETTLKKAAKYQFIDICKELSYDLALIYSTRGNEKYVLYKSKYDYYLKIESDEKFIRFLYHDLAFLLSKQKKPSGKNLEKILSIFDQILAVASDSYEINLLKFQSKMTKATLLNDHKEIFQALNEALACFDSYPFESPNGFLFGFLHKVTPSLILTERFTEAEKNINRCLSLLAKGNFNWHVTIYYKMILGFYSEDYEMAKNAILLSKKYISSLSDFMIEAWKIAEVYWYFASLVGLVEFEGTFRTTKFLNDFTIYNKDKAGANASIKLMAEYLVELAKGNRDTLIDNSDALRLYAYHNLRDESNQRSRLFFWIIQQLPKCNFELESFKSKTEEKFKQLKSIPAKIEDIETEIIPYENLYSIVLKILEKNLVK